MKIPFKTVPWVAIGTVAIAAVILLSIAWCEQKLQVSLKTGGFEMHYMSTVDKLSRQMQNIFRKQNCNMITDAELSRPKPLPTPVAPSDDPETDFSIDDLNLSGIYWNRTAPLIEINGNLCRPGDDVSGFTVERIEPYRVTLKDPEGKIQTISLIKKTEKASL